MPKQFPSPFHRTIATATKATATGTGTGTTTATAATTITTLPVDETRLDGNNADASTSSSAPLALLAGILRPYHERQVPVVVRGAVRGAPATARWSSLDYWRSTIGGDDNNYSNSDINSDNDDPTMVAVEIGGSYGSTSSERAEIPLSAYLQFLEVFGERYGTEGCLPWETTENGGDADDTPQPQPEEQELVYMAQNDLLPELYPDVWIPDCCRSGDERSASYDSSNNNSNDGSNSNSKSESKPDVVGLGRLYSVMVWLGPRGCVSPLHFDPLDNCLMHHAGRKRVLLFAPNGSGTSTVPWHYAGHDGQQSNTSPVDPEVLDWWLCANNSSRSSSRGSGIADRLVEKHRKNYSLFFEHAPDRLECVLEPGDLLYIPSKWWHHVRSIDASASVNVWWR